VSGSRRIKLDEALSGVVALGFDTPPFIYFIERDQKHLPVLREVFRRIDAGAIQGYSSVITLTEVLTKPRAAGDVTMERAELLTGSRNFTLLSIDSRVASNAADLRARYGLRTPDALQVAAGLNAGCQALLTNDSRFRRVSELTIFVLDELEA